MEYFLTYFVSFIYIVPLLIGVGKFRSLSKSEKVFLLFIIFSSIVSITTALTSSSGNNNLYFLYIFAAGEAVILSIFLFDKKELLKLKFLVALGTIFLISLIAFEAFLRDGGVEKFNNISLTINSIVLGSLSIRYLIKLRYDQTVDNLAANSQFWFCSGLAIYYFGNILVFAFLRLFQESQPDLLLGMFRFRLATLYLSSFAYIIGFLKIKSGSGPRKVAFS